MIDTLIYIVFLLCRLVRSLAWRGERERREETGKEWMARRLSSHIKSINRCQTKPAQFVKVISNSNWLFFSPMKKRNPIVNLKTIFFILNNVYETCQLYVGSEWQVNKCFSSDIQTMESRFIRYPSVQARSSNGFVELGRFFYNLITAIFKCFHLLQYSIITFNNTIASLPFFVRYIVHGIIALCFPFYAVYRTYMLLFNRITRIVYPLYRAVTLFTRILAFFIQLPVRIITYLLTSLEHFFKTLLILLIAVSLLFGIVLLFLDEHQLIFLKSYFHNKTNLFFNRTVIL